MQVTLLLVVDQEWKTAQPKIILACAEVVDSDSQAGTSKHSKSLLFNLEECAREHGDATVKNGFGGSAYRIAKRHSAAMDEVLEEVFLFLIGAMLHRNSKTHGFADPGNVIFRLVHAVAPLLQLRKRTNSSLQPASHLNAAPMIVAKQGHVVLIPEWGVRRKRSRPSRELLPLTCVTNHQFRRTFPTPPFRMLP